MKIELTPEHTAAPNLFRPEKNDRAGVGVLQVNAFLKPLKAGITLPDGVKFLAQRRGLKVMLGSPKRDGLMRRLAGSRDQIVMLRAALDEAGAKIGVRLVPEGGQLFLEAPSQK